MRRLALAVLVAALFGCATTPKLVGDSYYSDKYRFSIEKPTEWQPLDLNEIPPELTGAIPPEFRRTIKKP